MNNFKEKTFRSKKYLDYIRNLECVCGPGCGKVEANHIKQKGLGGMGLKVSDLRTLPFCRAHHDEYHINREGTMGKYCRDVNKELMRAMIGFIKESGDDGDPMDIVVGALEDKIRRMEGG
jgi:hypothetical protein